MESLVALRVVAKETRSNNRRELIERVFGWMKAMVGLRSCDTAAVNGSRD